MSQNEKEDFKKIKERFDERMKDQRALTSEANTFHDEKGHFTGPEDAVVYSLTNAALKSGAVKDKSKIKRGKYNKSSGKTTSLYGANTSKTKSCGRKRMDGSAKSPTHSCSKYPQKYEENQEDHLNDAQRTPFMKIKVKTSKTIEEMTDNDLSKVPNYKLIDVLAALKVMIAENPEEAEFINRQFNKLGFYHQSQLSEQCSKRGYKTMDQWIEFENRQSLASKGELFKTPKK